MFALVFLVYIFLFNKEKKVPASRSLKFAVLDDVLLGWQGISISSSTTIVTQIILKTAMQNYYNISENLATVGEVSGYILLKLNRNQVELMSKCDLSVGDVRYIPVYEEYLRLRQDGSKKKQTIAYLAGKYFLSESTVKRVIKRLSRRVTA